MICDTCEKYPCDMDGTKLWHRCFAYSPKPKPITKADSIRAMSDEELADLFSKIEHGDPENHLGKDGWLVWLKMEGKT